MKKTHWFWSLLLLLTALTVAGVFVFNSIQESQKANSNTESATQYQNDLAANTFTEENEETEPESKPKEKKEDDGNQAVVEPAHTKPEIDELIWCGDGKEGRQNRFGWPEYHVCKRRAEIGKPLPDDWSALAQTFINLATEEGYEIDKSPSQYSILYRVYQGYLYHIAFVEKINPNGSIEVSEMNHINEDGEGGWGLISKRTIPKDELALNQYID